MLRQDLLIYQTRTLLGEFLAPMLESVDKPRKRFLQQVLRGILFSGSLVVMKLCRWIPDDCTDRFYQDKRLPNHLVSPSGDLTEAVSHYRQSLRQYIEPDTALIIDLTDLARISIPRETGIPEGVTAASNQPNPIRIGSLNRQSATSR